MKNEIFEMNRSLFGRKILRLSGACLLFVAVFASAAPCRGSWHGSVRNTTLGISSSMVLYFDISGSQGTIDVAPPLYAEPHFEVLTSNQGGQYLHTEKNGQTIDWLVEECNLSSGHLRGKYNAKVMGKSEPTESGHFDLVLDERESLSYTSIGLRLNSQLLSRENFAEQQAFDGEEIRFRLIDTM